MATYRVIFGSGSLFKDLGADTFSADGDGPPRLWSNNDLVDPVFMPYLTFLAKRIPIIYGGGETPVTVLSVSVVDSQTLRVTLSDPVVSNPALTNPNNYEITPALKVLDVTVVSNNIVDLSVEEMKDGEAYTLTIHNTLEKA